MKKILALILFFGVAFGLELNDLEHLKKNKISGDWKQEKQISGFGVIKSEGNFKLDNKILFWHITKPIENIIKIDESGIWHKKNDEWIYDKKSANKEVFLDILNLDFSNLEDYFSISILGEKNNWDIELRPKNTILKKVFKKVEISGKTHIDSVLIIESSGDITKNIFYNVKE